MMKSRIEIFKIHESFILLHCLFLLLDNNITRIIIYCTIIYFINY